MNDRGKHLIWAVTTIVCVMIVAITHAHESGRQYDIVQRMQEVKPPEPPVAKRKKWVRHAPQPEGDEE